MTTPAKAGHLVAAVPASYVAFDLLAIGGVDLRTQRWSVRRRRLEQLASTWAAPPTGRGQVLQLSPVTSDVDEARDWFEVLGEALGGEGLVVKGASSRYTGGRRDWLKVNSVGVAVFGPISLGLLIEVSALCGVPGRCATGVADGVSSEVLGNQLHR